MRATWRRVRGKLRAFTGLGVICLLAVLGFLLIPSVESRGAGAVSPQTKTPTSADIVEELRSREAEMEARWEQERLASDRRTAAMEALHLVEPTPPRKVRRFEWGAPRAGGRVWHVPEGESEQATLTAFLRVCLAEADGAAQDCIGIWQTVQNIRRRNCPRDRIHRITECVEGEGETMLSAFRRSQSHVLGYVPPRHRRAAWLSKLSTDCDCPEGYTGDENQWEAHYRQRCSSTVALGRHLMRGDLPPSVPGHRAQWLPGRPIAWGGRCETGRGACDDRLACSRGLARIPTSTENAFWCRIGSPGCSDDTDPVCVRMGFPSLRIPSAPIPSESAEVITSGPPTDENS